MYFAGNVVAITSAAQGIGRTSATAFAGKGAKIAFFDVRAEQVTTAAAELRSIALVVYTAVAGVTGAEAVEEFVANGAASVSCRPRVGGLTSWPVNVGCGCSGRR